MAPFFFESAEWQIWLTKSASKHFEASGAVSRVGVRQVSTSRFIFLTPLQIKGEFDESL
jgi:hypothetical protein